MALKIKVVTVRVPNLDQQFGDRETEDGVKEIEGVIEDAVKAKFNDGYEFLGMAGGDNFAILIFKKA